MIRLCKTLLVLLLTGISLEAQTLQSDDVTLYEVSFFVDINNPRYKQVEGTRYINEAFIPAKINNFNKLYPLRLDVVNNVMEFKENNKDIRGISPTQDYRIVFSNPLKSVFVSNTIINESGDLQRVFLEEISAEQEFTLYKRERKQFQAAKPAKSGYESAIPAAFKNMKDSYYVDFANDNIDYLLQIPKNKKKIKTFFGDLGPEVLKYAKKERLKFDSEENLISILNFYVEKR
ncbi:hypothetical protein ACOKFD_08810 [Flagellimonas sp. S174]|uniref:hypothetical protein n=1 Tax=Flagellimonas sp. S174 TaxID=3410790 RepID=UPI003BF5D4BA